ncbi:hypothetical protein ACQKCH_14660 [Nubsella zeaxanthinifaciens]|uniref:hypothetical protein n=1 Tax=Nubsella zeaxanthinifaciens TaxID=392412 RepID=UPI003CFFAFFA
MEKKYSGFPNGYEHLETVFQPLRAQVDDLINQIENMPPDKGYRPELKIEGAPFSREKSRFYKIAELEDKKDKLQQSMMKIAEDASSNAEPAIRREVLDKADHIVYSEKYAEFSKEEFSPNTKKDVSKSQDFSRWQVFEAKYLVRDEPEIAKQAPASLKESIEAFANKTEPKTALKENTKEPEITKEGRFADNKDNGAMFEKSVDGFFNKTAYNYAVNKDDILSTPEIGGGGSGSRDTKQDIEPDYDR